MEIRNIRHKGLRNLVENDNAKGLSLLINMDKIEEIQSLQKFKPHLLTGDREGTYSLSVTPNWRITFRYDEQADELFDVDYEDYH